MWLSHSNSCGKYTDTNSDFEQTPWSNMSMDLSREDAHTAASADQLWYIHGGRYP